MSATVVKLRVVIRSGWCKGCGICAAFCPKSALTLINGKAALVEKDRCISCGMCEMRCPDYAIHLEEETSDV